MVRRYCSHRLRAGVVYLVRDPSGRHKIGYTVGDLRTRIGTLCSSTRADLLVVHFVLAENAPALEHRLHERYEARRVDGEWFQLTAADVAEIRSLTTDSARAYYHPTDVATGDAAEDCSRRLATLAERIPMWGRPAPPWQSQRVWNAIKDVVADALKVKADRLRA